MKRDENDVVRAYSGPLVLVEVYKGTLEEAGITCRVVGTELTGSFGSALSASVELWVHSGDLARAQELIAREERAKGEAPHNQFPHPTSAPNPGPAPLRHEPYVNPDPGA
ncbi:MAG TPA: DUF2007 domain-containing protein [Gemmata sp.]